MQHFSLWFDKRSISLPLSLTFLLSDPRCSFTVMSTIWYRQTKRHTIDSDIEMYAKTLAHPHPHPHPHNRLDQYSIVKSFGLPKHPNCACTCAVTLQFHLNSFTHSLFLCTRKLIFADSCICNLVNHSPLCIHVMG